MKRGIILLNGDPYGGAIDTEGATVVCCDGALVWASEKGVKADIVLGDFDSLGYTPEGAILFPAEKDETDGEIALDHLAGMGVERIDIYGGSGRREDHFFGNVGLLLKAHERGMEAIFHSDYTDFFVSDGKVSFEAEVGTVVSVVPVTDSVHIYDSRGMKYGMKDLTIARGSTRGISNVTTAKEFCIEIDSGTALIFKVRKL